MVDSGGDVFSSEFDWVDVTGDLALAGSLEVELVFAFELDDLYSFEIINVNGDLVGQFDGLDEGAIVGNFGAYDLLISYSGGDGNDVVLFTETANILPGDVNMDGQVDLLDVTPFVTLLNNGEFQAEADVNEDGQVDLLDIAPFVALLMG